MSPTWQPALSGDVAVPACYARQGERAFETYWTNRRGVEAVDNSNALLDSEPPRPEMRAQLWTDARAPQMRWAAAARMLDGPHELERNT